MSDATIVDCPLCTTQLRIRTMGLERVSVKCPKCDYSFVYPPEAEAIEAELIEPSPSARSHLSPKPTHNHAPASSVPIPRHSSDLAPLPDLEFGTGPKTRLRGTLRTGSTASTIGWLLAISAACLVFLFVGALILRAYIQDPNQTPIAADVSPEQVVNRLNAHTTELAGTLATIKNSTTRDEALPFLKQSAEESQRILFDASRLQLLDAGELSTVEKRLARLRSGVQELDRVISNFDPKRDFLGGEVGVALRQCNKNREAIEMHLRGLVALPSPSNKAERALFDQVAVQRKLVHALAECDNAVRVESTVAKVMELADELNAVAEKHGGDGAAKRARGIEVLSTYANAEQGVEAILDRHMERLVNAYGNASNLKLALVDFQDMVVRSRDAAYDVAVHRLNADAKSRIAKIAANSKVAKGESTAKSDKDEEMRSLWNREAKNDMAMANEPNPSNDPSAPARPKLPPVPKKGPIAAGMVGRQNGGLAQGGSDEKVDSMPNAPGQVDLPSLTVGSSIDTNSSPQESGSLEHMEGTGMFGPGIHSATIGGSDGSSHSPSVNASSDPTVEAISAQVGEQKSLTGAPMMPPKNGSKSGRNSPNKPSTTKKPEPKKPETKKVVNGVPELFRSMKVDERVLLIVQPIEGLDRDRITKHFEEELGASVVIQSKGDQMFIAIMYRGSMAKVEELIQFGKVRDANPESRVIFVAGKPVEDEPNP